MTVQNASVGLFVRKVRTGSGATAVQIARTDRGVQTIVEHLGSTHDGAQLAALVAIARERIAGMQQLDLESLTPASPPRSEGPPPLLHSIPTRTAVAGRNRMKNGL
ncbi:hypothetical protein MRBLWH3_000250 [Microbacterium sp. LWH3-1.2]